MVKWFLLSAIVALVASAALAVAADKGPDVIKIPATLGEITFNHAGHVERTPECTECHHKGVAQGKCTGCHAFRTTNGVPLRKKAFHAQCKGCHAEQGAPTNCKGCHAMSR